MPGIRFKVDSTKMKQSIVDLRRGLNDLGVTTKTTEKDIKALEKEVGKTAQLEKKRREFDKLTKSLGLSATEAELFAKKYKISLGKTARDQAVDQMRLDLKNLGIESKLTSKDFAKFQRQVGRTVELEKTRKSFDNLTRSMGLTAKESRRLAKQFNIDLAGNRKGLAQLSSGLDKVAKNIFSIQTMFATLGAGFAIQKTLSAFSTVNSGLIAVQKTTGMTDEELKIFDKDLRLFSLHAGMATEGLFDIAEAAGQLGVKGVDNILLFTKTLTKMQAASDIVGEDGAKSLARLLNTTGESITGVKTLGSVIVALGNDMAASESEILRMASDIGRSTSAFAVSSSAAAAWGAALRSLGAQAELSGSAIGRTMIELQKTIFRGGDNLTKLQTLTKMTGEQLKQTFEKDSARVFNAFIKGINESGKRSVDVLEEFGLAGTENVKALSPLIKNVGLLDKAFKLANKEVANATALDKEAIAASKSFEAQMQMTWNAVDSIAAGIGSALAPSIVDVTQKFRDWVEQNDDFLRQDLPKKIKETADQIKGIITPIGEFFDAAINGWSSMPKIIREVGIVGALIGGTKGKAALVGGVILSDWAADLGAALGLVSAGVLDFSEVMRSSDLSGIIKKFDEDPILFKLEMQAKSLEKEIESLKSMTEGKVFYFEDDKRRLKELKEELKEVVAATEDYKNKQKELKAVTEKETKETKKKTTVEEIKETKKTEIKMGASIEELRQWNDEYKKSTTDWYEYEKDKIFSIYDERVAKGWDSVKAEEWMTSEIIKLAKKRSGEVFREDEARIASIERMVQSYEDQARTINMTAEELAEYRLQSLGATQADIDRAKAAIRSMQTDKKVVVDTGDTEKLLELKKGLAQLDIEALGYSMTAEELAKKRLAIYEQQYAIEEAKLEKMAIGADATASEISAYNSQSEVLSEINQKIVEQKELLQDRTAIDGARTAMKEYADEASNVGKQMSEIFTDAFTQMEDAFIDFVKTGKLSFSDLVDSISKDILRMMVRANITAPLAGWLNTGIGGLATMFGGFGGGAWGSAGPIHIGAGGTTAFGMHTGYAPGDKPNFTRQIPDAAFANAPRFHNGIGPNEQKAVIKKDEGVFTKGQMSAMAPISSLIAAMKQANGVNSGGINEVSVSVPVTINGNGGGVNVAAMKSEIEETVISVIRKYANA